MKPNPPAKAAPRRVGLREVARAADVSIMTVSLALRDSPKISAPTRQRVRQLAAELGYRPDPEISRLMGRLQTSRSIPGSIVLALLDLRPALADTVHPYDARLRAGAVRRAEELGYGAAVFRLADYDGRLKSLVRVLRARGIAGAILLPSPSPMALDPAVNWQGISVVAATTAVKAPRFHRVGPNQLFNLVTLLETMHARGHRKIGAVFNEILEQRTAHQYSMALAWHGHREHVLILPGDSFAGDHRATVTAWLRRHQPDIVLAQNAEQLAPLVRRRGAKAPELVSLSGENELNLPYQDQLPELIGETAVSLLTGMMHNHEIGIPRHAHVMTIDGAFREPGTK